MKILYCKADQPGEANCSKYLCEEPTVAINKAGTHSANCIHINEFIQNNETTQNLVSEADIIILERNLFNDALTLMQYWKVRGKNFAICFDDGYSVIHPKNVSYDFWTKGELHEPDANGNMQTGYINPLPLTQMGWAISMSKGLQTVTQAIVDDWAHCNDGYVIQHHLVTERYKNATPLFPHDGKIWVAWSGSMSHVDSFESSGVLPAFERISKRYKNVVIFIAGDKRVYDIINLPQGKKIYAPYVPLEQYPNLLKSIDIFAIPLAGEYDKRRSQIKPVEAGIVEVPTLCTDYPNYQHLKPYHHMTQNGTENWDERLSDMIENLPKYREYAHEVTLPHSQSQDINLHVQERIDLYQKLIEKPYRFSFPPDFLELKRSKVQ